MVIVPKSTLANWMKEFVKWTPVDKGGLRAFKFQSRACAALPAVAVFASAVLRLADLI
jgi:hypothetical protein